VELPLILAGPILRRVEPNLVSVWLALSKSASAQLTLWEGPAAPSSPSLISGPQPAAQTIRIGDKLHVSVVTLKLELGAGQTLLPGRIYSYDVTLQTAEGSENLSSCGLLKDEPISSHPHLALGYEPGLLPSFALPPPALTDLRIVHGSCRRSSASLPDGLPWLDDLIHDARKDLSSYALTRPHQLLMSGDQIYADDVTIVQMQVVNDLSQVLFGSPRDASGELAPIERIPVGDKRYAADLNNFPAGQRLKLVQDEARMTSTDGDSHLFSFGEFCAMYLLTWSSACWPPESEWPKQEAFLPPFAWVGLIASDLRDKVTPPIKTDDPGAIKRRKRQYEGAIKKFKNVLKTMPKVRRALANVPTYMIFDDHEITDDWYLNPTWRDRVLTNPLGKTIIRNGLVSYALFQGWGNDPVKFESGEHKRLLDLATQLFPEGATTGPNEVAGDEMDHLLGLDQASGLAEGNPPLKWHYSIPGTRHMGLVLDNRTRRSFVTRDGPIGNVSISAQQDQIPLGPLPAGIEVLVVVAPLQVIGPPVLDEIIGPLSYRALDLKDHGELQKHSGSRNITATNPDAVEGWAYDVKTFEALLKRLEPFVAGTTRKMANARPRPR